MLSDGARETMLFNYLTKRGELLSWREDYDELWELLGD